jgi:threonine dehydratase
VIAGQGTIGLEISQQIHAERYKVFVPIGGGGLIAGSATAVRGARPQAAVYGVEPADADDTLRSLRTGERVRIAPPSTIADGLRITMPGALTFPVVQRLVKDVLVVSEEEIMDAIRFALLRLKLVIEPSGAVPLAAALAGRLPAGAQRVGLLITGGNIDPPVLAGLW